MRILKRWRAERKAIMEGRVVAPPAGTRDPPVLRALTPAEESLGDELEDLDTSLENAMTFISQQDPDGLFALPVWMQ